MEKLNPNDYRAEFDRFADVVNLAVRNAAADALQSYSGPMPDAVQWYAAVSGIITAGGFLSKGMVDLFGLDPEPLIGALPDQFREGMAGPQSIKSEIKTGGA